MSGGKKDKRREKAHKYVQIQQRQVREGHVEEMTHREMNECSDRRDDEGTEQ